MSGTIKDRGFASMNRKAQKELASKGGKAAHAQGTAHEWDSKEAAEAGRKGGLESHRRRRLAKEAAAAEAEANRRTVQTPLNAG